MIRPGTAEWLSDVTIAPRINGNNKERNVPVIGYLVVLNSSTIRSLDDISSDSRLYGNPDIFGKACAADPAFGSVLFSRVSLGEACNVLLTGACSGLVVSDIEKFKAAMGREANIYNTIPLRGL